MSDKGLEYQKYLNSLLESTRQGSFNEDSAKDPVQWIEGNPQDFYSRECDRINDAKAQALTRIIVIGW